VSLVEDLDRDGWVVVRGVVPAEELPRLRRAHAWLIPAIAYPPRQDGVLWEVTGAARHVPLLGEIVHDARWGRLAAGALGCDAVQLLQDSLLYKPPREGAPVEWHQDHTYVGFLTPPRVISLRLALHDEDQESGCMRVVDGSHRWGPVGGVRALSEAQVDSLVPSLSPEQRAALETARPLELAAGDISIHHCLTLHGSGPNRAERPRRTLILRMFDAACRLDPGRLPPGGETHFPTTADGRLDPSAFPLTLR
jgi:hypothetical protein